MRLGNLIEDWGGFERLVAELHRTGEVSVEHNVVLVGKSGAPRQIDVLIRHRQGLYEHLIIVECKHWTKNVGRLYVDAMVTSVQDLNASKGVIFSVVGFQEGALTVARHYGLDLYTVREMKASEWGAPGQVIDFFLQVAQRSIEDLELHGVSTEGGVSPVHLSLHLADDGHSSTTPIVDEAGAPAGTLEGEILKASMAAFLELTSVPAPLNGGEAGQYYAHKEVILRPPTAYRVPVESGFVRIEKMRFRVGSYVFQSRLTHDRAASFKFALALDDQVRGTTTLANKRKDATDTVLSAVDPLESGPTSDILLNGSVILLRTKNFVAKRHLA